MYIKVYIWLTIVCKIITANNWTIINEGNCFYTVISKNTSSIDTNEISPCDNISPYITLIFTNTNISLIPSNFFNTTFNPWIRIFQAKNNTWRIISSSAFSNLKNILSIDLSGNRIKTINSAFKDLETLDSLNLSHNLIEDINSDIFTTSENETRIHLLDLSHNLLSHVDKNLFEKLHNLRMLYLQGNKITILGDDSFVHLKKLVYLNVCCNSLTTLGTQMVQLKFLSDLDVSFNSIEELNNDTFTGLVFLNTIDFSHNKLETLPMNFLDELPSLFSINLKYNNISNISSYLSDQFVSKGDIIHQITSLD